jgi:hypothetical protein
VFSRRLHQLGRFEIMPEMVVTSGRTVRLHTGIEALKIVAAFLLRGPGFFRTRRGPWYGKRGNDVDPPA